MLSKEGSPFVGERRIGTESKQARSSLPAARKYGRRALGLARDRWRRFPIRNWMLSQLSPWGGPTHGLASSLRTFRPGKASSVTNVNRVIKKSVLPKSVL